MTKEFIDKVQNICQVLVRIIGGTRFSWFIIALFVLQAVWVALSLKWVIFDERFHFGIIQVYTNHMWPVIYDQPHSYDVYRDFAGEGSKLYHFLMSFPLRGLELITTDIVWQLKDLRFFYVIMVAVGLIWFYRLFDTLNVRRLHANIGVFILVLLPITAWIGGSVNYDNFIFMITPMFLYVLIDILKSKKVSFLKLILFGLIGMVGALVKFTFLIVFLVGILVVLFAWYKNGWRSFVKFWNNEKAPLRLIDGLLIATFTVVMVLFVQTYVLNFLQYGTPRPSCQRTLGVERCLSNSVIQTNESQKDTSALRPEYDWVQYSAQWLGGMYKTATYSAGVTDGKLIERPPLPFVISMMIFAAVISILSIARWLLPRRDVGISVMLLVAGAIIVTVFVSGLSVYQDYHAYRAIQFRYILPAFLLIVTIGTMMLHRSAIVKRYNTVITMTVFTALVLVSVQGGGVISYLVNADKDWYWPGVASETNSVIQGSLKPLIKESEPYPIAK